MSGKPRVVHGMKGKRPKGATRPKMGSGSRSFGIRNQDCRCAFEDCKSAPSKGSAQGLSVAGAPAKISSKLDRRRQFTVPSTVLSEGATSRHFRRSCTYKAAPRRSLLPPPVAPCLRSLALNASLHPMWSCFLRHFTRLGFPS